MFQGDPTSSTPCDQEEAASGLFGLIVPLMLLGAVVLSAFATWYLTEFMLG